MSQYPWLLLAVYVVTVGVVQLLALWAATSTRPWLLRAVVVWVPIALLATIRVYEPALVLLVSAALTIGLSFAVQRIGLPRERSNNARPRFWRFRLADLLVLTLFLATWLGITTARVALEDQLSLLLPVTLAATPLALLTQFVHRAVAGPMRVRATLLALSVIGICALLLRTFNMRLYLGEGHPSLGPNWPSETAFTIGLIGAMVTAVALCAALLFGVWKATKNWAADLHRRAVLVATVVALVGGLPMGYLAWEFVPGDKWKTLCQWCLELGIHSVFFVALATFVALGSWLARSGWGTATGWKRVTARAAVLVLAVVLVPPAGWTYWQMLWYAPYPKVKAGPENHYDRLVAIAKHMNTYARGGPLPNALAAELDEAVLLLREHFQVPQHVIESGWNPETGLTHNDIMALTGRFSEAAENAAKRGEIDRAADFALAIIRFDAMAGQGEQGNYAHQGYALLSQQRGTISPAKSRDVIGMLRKTLAERHDVEFVIARHHAQSERMLGWHHKLHSTLAQLAGKTFYDPSALGSHIRETRRSWDTLNLLMQTDLALRLFQSGHGGLPPTLEELVPNILSELPIDPYSGQPLIYRPAEKEFVIYSVGPDGVDNGGMFLKRFASGERAGSDIRLD